MTELKASMTIDLDGEILVADPELGLQVCRHCTYRSDDVCIHPVSLVNDGYGRTVVFSESGPVCVGDVACVVQCASVAY